VTIADNPNTEHPQHTEGVEPFALATAGIRGNRCAVYSLNGTQIYTPVAASVEFGRHDKFKWKLRHADHLDFDAPSYKVFVTTSSSNRGIIPKSEIVIVEPAHPQQSAKVEYQSKEITRDAVQFLNKLTSNCVLPKDEVLAIHKKLAGALNYSITAPFNSRSYKIMGLTAPKSLSIKDGLQSLKVRVGDAGVYTEISIGDNLFTPPSPDLITRALEHHRSADLAKLRTNVL